MKVGKLGRTDGMVDLEVNGKNHMKVYFEGMRYDSMD
jgi:hypothetical protein